MTTEREAFEQWEDDFITRNMEQPKPIDAWQASRKVALTDVMVVATVGATYPELMEYMQGELK